MRRLLLLGSAGLLLAGTSFAQSSDEEVIVVGTIIGESDVSDLSSPVGILTEADIENRNQNYLAELLRSQPGVSVNRSGPGGGLTQIRLRGAEASHVLVLVDGIEVANPTAGEFDLSGIRAADVERIEILRGEQSALYGSDAIGGVINIITRAGATHEYWQASIEGGSFGTIDGQFNGAINLGGASLTLGVGGLSTEGYDISNTGGEKDSSKSRNLSLGINNLNIEGIRFSAKFTDTTLDTEFDPDSPFDGVLDDRSDFTIVDTQSARIDAQFSVGDVESLITLSGHDISTDTRGGSTSLSEGTRRKASWAVKYGIDQHNFTVLGEIESETYAITPSFAFAPSRPKNTNHAIVGDYRGEFGRLAVTASARNDFNDRFDDAFTWKLGATYGFDFGGRLRGSLGTGVKNPSLIELFGFFPESNFVGNPDLRPEESFGYGIGYSHGLGDLNLSLDYFRSELTDEIFTDFSSFPFLARNRTTDSKREGVEFSADWKPSNNISFYGSATFLDTEENGVQELRRPEFQASATATFSPIKDIVLTGSIDHTGSQLDTDFATFLPVELEAFTLVGLNAAYNVNDHVTLTLRGENLLDEDYEEVVGYRSQGRGIYGGLRLRFD